MPGACQKVQNEVIQVIIAVEVYNSFHATALVNISKVSVVSMHCILPGMSMQKRIYNIGCFVLKSVQMLTIEQML
jgi:hypothetical protein